MRNRIFKIYQKLMRVIIIISIIPNILSACTIFDTKSSSGEILVGRNFDYLEITPQIDFIPSNRDSYGVVLLSSVNPNMPYEGMNDRGLLVAILAVPYSETTINILKPIRKSLEMVKIILQRASTIDEAIEQFDRYSIAFGQFLGNPLVHFKIVQKNGDSAVVEFVHNRRVVIKSKRGGVLTNHYLSDLSIRADSNTSLQRYNIVKKSLKRSSTTQEVFEILKRCEQKNSLWSTVYNLTKQELYLSYKRGESVKFNLKDELYRAREPFFYSMQASFTNPKTHRHFHPKENRQYSPLCNKRN